MAKKPVVLIIRDGWGVNPGGKDTAVKDGNATLLAKTPYHEVMFAKYPKSLVSASGLDVGLPPGQMGNSEVGHLNLGRVALFIRILPGLTKPSTKEPWRRTRCSATPSKKRKAVVCTSSGWFRTEASIVTKTSSLPW